MLNRHSSEQVDVFVFVVLNLFILFIFGCIGSSLLRAGFSSCDERGPLPAAVHGLLTAVSPTPHPNPVAEHGLQAHGPSSCGSLAQQLWLAGSRVQAQKLGRTGLVALQHVGSSQTRT